MARVKFTNLIVFQIVGGHKELGGKLRRNICFARVDISYCFNEIWAADTLENISSRTGGKGSRYMFAPFRYRQKQDENPRTNRRYLTGGFNASAPAFSRQEA